MELGAYVVMPNHVHGILIINGDNVGNDDAGDNGGENVETGHALSLQQKQKQQLPPPDYPPPTIGQQRFQNIGKNSISSVVGSYKSAVTKHAHRLGFEFQWQSRFYDHIIRDAASFERITSYIMHNVVNWKEDKFF